MWRWLVDSLDSVDRFLLLLKFDLIIENWNGEIKLFSVVKLFLGCLLSSKAEVCFVLLVSIYLFCPLL